MASFREGHAERCPLRATACEHCGRVGAHAERCPSDKAKAVAIVRELVQRGAA